jgi:DNA-directed RNA polymerase specialized sigma24 family protein
MPSHSALNITTGEEVLEIQAEAARKRRSELLVLRKQGMSVRTIAAKMKLSTQRVHVLLKKARKDHQTGG